MSRISCWLASIPATLKQAGEKTKSILRAARRSSYLRVVIIPPILPLEDELGDVMEKAMRRADLTAEALAERARVPLPRILDASDYRSDLTCDELRRIAAVLELNEGG